MRFPGHVDVDALWGLKLMERADGMTWNADTVDWLEVFLCV
jgi:hypothetical protein